MIVDSEVVSLRDGVHVDFVDAGAVVRWIRRSGAGQPRGREEGGERQEGGAGADDSLVGGVNYDGDDTTMTFLSDDIDDPPVTRPMLCDGQTFDRPGRYTYIVSSGPLTVGRLVVPEVSKERRRKRRPAAAKVLSSKSSPCGDSDVAAGTDAGRDGKTTVVGVNDDIDHSLPGAATSTTAVGSLDAPSKPENVLAVAGASKALVPPTEGDDEALECLSVEDSEKVRCRTQKRYTLVL